MEISEDALNTGRNIAWDWLYSSTETFQELYRKKTTYIGTIIPNK